MKINDLIELLKTCDPESYIHLLIDNAIYTFEVKRQYPDSDFNFNMVIEVPSNILNVKDGENKLRGTLVDNYDITGPKIEKDILDIVDEEPIEIIDIDEIQAEEE